MQELVSKTLKYYLNIPESVENYVEAVFSHIDHAYLPIILHKIPERNNIELLGYL